MMEVYRFKDWYIPERMMGGIRRYIESGFAPGDFLQAMISNDLKEAVSLADDENLKNLPAYVAYFYNETPSACWGSKERMIAWIDRFKIKCESCGARINPDDEEK